VNKIAGLLLAAGTSMRMGKPKQMLPAGGMTLLDRILGQALNSNLELVVLVLGFKSQEILHHLQTDRYHPKLRIIENTRFREGIGSSIIAGLSVVEKDYNQVMIILADMPHITSDLINHLLHAYFESRLPLGAVRTKKRRSHPVIISRPFYPHLHELRGDTGARRLFTQYPDRVCVVETDNDFVDLDIDTREDYLKFKEMLEKSQRRPPE